MSSSRAARHTSLIHSEHSPLVAVAAAARRIAPSDATVLLTGETGTGKEVFARHIHQMSSRADRAFVPVNCGAIPEALIESELFGHMRGAFTGATNSRKGRVAAAEGGTLFLDEIGELSLNLQVKLLRLLQERSYEPVGSAESVSADFRLVAATNRDLALEVEAGRFRRDLYYRLMVCPLQLPSLRDRPQDARPLFEHFWRERGEARQVLDEVFFALEAHSWPGNVRELQNLVERLSVCTEGPVITAAHLPFEVRSREVPRPSAPWPQPTYSAPIPMAHYSAPVPSAPTPMPQQAATAPAPSAPAAPMPPAPSTFFPPSAPPLSAMAPELPAPHSSPPLPPAGFLPLPSAPTWAPMPPLPSAHATPPPPRASAPLTHPAADGRSITIQLDPGLPPLTVALPVNLPNLLRALEEACIDAALERSDGSRKSAADLLGLQRTTLVEKLRRRSRELPAVAV